MRGAAATKLARTGDGGVVVVDDTTRRTDNGNMVPMRPYRGGGVYKLFSRSVKSTRTVRRG